MEMPVQMPDPAAAPEKRKRSVLFVAACLFGWVFFFTLLVIYFLPLLYPGRFADILNKYTPGGMLTRGQVLFFALAESLLHAGAFTGIIIMWMHKKWGFYLFGLTTLSITVIQLFQQNVRISATLVYILLLIIFGLFSRKK